MDIFRKVCIAFGIIVFFVLQSSVLGKLNMGGIIPNVILIYTVVMALMHGEITGTLVGFFSGFLIDIFFGNFLGFYALAYMLIGFLNGKLCGVFYPEDIKLPLGMILCSNLSYGMFCYVFLFLLRGKLHFSYYFSHIVLPEILYTLVAALFVYPILLLLYKGFNKALNKVNNGFY